MNRDSTSLHDTNLVLLLYFKFHLKLLSYYILLQQWCLLVAFNRDVMVISQRCFVGKQREEPDERDADKLTVSRHVDKAMPWMSVSVVSLSIK